MIRREIRNWWLGKSESSISYNQQLCNCKPMEIASALAVINN